MPAQPQDEWTYLRPEEFADDDAVERIEEAFDSSPEETAVHELDPDVGTAAAVLDPGETAERAPSRDEVPTQYFDDEEPDRGPGGEAVGEVETELGVDELLVSQHYTFDPDGQ